MGLRLVNDEYLNILNSYTTALNSENIDEALKIAMHNLPDRMDEVMNKKLEQFFNPQVKKRFPPEIEDYEDTLRLCRTFMPEKFQELALEFYNFFKDEITWNDDALDIARVYVPEKIEEAANRLFNEILRDEENYYDAFLLKDEFPNLINHNIHKVAHLAFEELLSDYDYYSEKLKTNKSENTYGIIHYFKIRTLLSLNAISQNKNINNTIIYEDNGTTVYYPLNLELRIKTIDEKYKNYTAVIL